MNEVFGVAGAVTVSPVFEHADVRLEKVEASSELDARGIWSRVLTAEMKQSLQVAEGSRSNRTSSATLRFPQQMVLCFGHSLGSEVICWLFGSIWNWSRISALQNAPVLVRFTCIV
jgi:hypothetical protein